MIRTKFITEEEALVLYEMIRNQNEYVMAAYELYCYDNKLDELQVPSPTLSTLLCSIVMVRYGGLLLRRILSSE